MALEIFSKLNYTLLSFSMVNINWNYNYKYKFFHLFTINAWKKLRKWIRVSTLITEIVGKKQEQKRYYITNIAGRLGEFVRTVRGHTGE